MTYTKIKSTEIINQERVCRLCVTCKSSAVKYTDILVGAYAAISQMHRTPVALYFCPQTSMSNFGYERLSVAELSLFYHIKNQDIYR